MSMINIKYKLDDKPPFGESLLYGLQWLAVAVPMAIIVGKVGASLQYNDPGQQILYIQKLFFIIGLAMLLQVIWGHRLPLIIGPAAVLLVGLVSSQGSDLSTAYFSIFCGGLAITFLSVTGLFGRLTKLFTPRVVVTILMLIGFTLTPIILKQIMPMTSDASPLANLVFCLVLVVSMFVANKLLKGIWKATLIIWAMLIGSVLYFFLFRQTIAITTGDKIVAGFFQDFNLRFSLDWGVLISFLICFLALAINDIGSITSIGEILQPEGMKHRLKNGITLTGMLNIFAGLFGVIGLVNYSLSPGVIASTGVASRHTLIPAGIGFIILAFLPVGIGIISSIPMVVIGSVLIYVMCTQIAAGLILAFASIKQFSFEDGLVLGTPLLLSVIISYLPSEAVAAFPNSLKPILGNGFVIGVLTVLIMEHLIYFRKKSDEQTS